MLTCKDATRLISERQERPLGFRERLGLRMHILMCVYCRRFERQIELMRKAMRVLGRRVRADTEGADLTPEARERIRKALAERDAHEH